MHKKISHENVIKVIATQNKFLQQLLDLLYFCNIYHATVFLSTKSQHVTLRRTLKWLLRPMKTSIWYNEEINKDIVNISLNFKLIELFNPELTDNYQIQKPLSLDWKMHTALVNWHVNNIIKEKSHTCKEGGAHLTISFWHLLMNLKSK